MSQELKILYALQEYVAQLKVAHFRESVAPETKKQTNKFDVMVRTPRK